jgi:hypothetical protein
MILLRHVNDCDARIKYRLWDDCVICPASQNEAPANGCVSSSGVRTYTMPTWAANDPFLVAAATLERKSW